MTFPIVVLHKQSVLFYIPAMSGGITMNRRLYSRIEELGEDLAVSAAQHLPEPVRTKKLQRLIRWNNVY